jgi:hypothetical protein
MITILESGFISPTANLNPFKNELLINKVASSEKNRIEKEIIIRTICSNILLIFNNLFSKKIIYDDTNHFFLD